MYITAALLLLVAIVALGEGAWPISLVIAGMAGALILTKRDVG